MAALVQACERHREEDRSRLAQVVKEPRDRERAQRDHEPLRPQFRRDRAQTRAPEQGLRDEKRVAACPGQGPGEPAHGKSLEHRKQEACDPQVAHREDGGCHDHEPVRVGIVVRVQHAHCGRTFAGDPQKDADIATPFREERPGPAIDENRHGQNSARQREQPDIPSRRGENSFIRARDHGKHGRKATHRGNATDTEGRLL